MGDVQRVLAEQGQVIEQIKGYLEQRHSEIIHLHSVVNNIMVNQQQLSEEIKNMKQQIEENIPTNQTLDQLFKKSQSDLEEAIRKVNERISITSMYVQTPVRLIQGANLSPRNYLEKRVAELELEAAQIKLEVTIRKATDCSIEMTKGIIEEKSKGTCHYTEQINKPDLVKNIGQVIEANNKITELTMVKKIAQAIEANKNMTDQMVDKKIKDAKPKEEDYYTQLQKKSKAEEELNAKIENAIKKNNNITKIEWLAKIRETEKNIEVQIQKSERTLNEKIQQTEQMVNK
ncbi:uncharacterized protein MCAP_0864-like isoform X2 [Ambystoma mexicanum]